MPHSRAATNTAGSIPTFFRGGEHSTTSGQPARRAGMPSIRPVDGNGALPAGTYRPTRPIGRTTRSHSTPGAVRSEARRVGREWVSTGRTRWVPEYYKKNRKTQKKHRKTM